MSAELIAAVALLAGMAACGWLCVRGRSPLDRLVALELASVLSVFVALLLALAFHRGAFVDLAVLLAVVSLPSGLVFVHFLERWV